MSTSETRGGRPTDARLTERILRATADLVLEDGYDLLRIENVARRAGCGKAAIYRRFANKAELVAAAAISTFAQELSPDSGSLEEDLMLHALSNSRNQKRGRGNGVLAVFEPAVYAIIDERYFAQRRNQGAEIIARGVQRGELPADVDGGLLLDAIAGLTLFRETIKGIDVPDSQYRDLIRALIAQPPRRRDSHR